MYVELHFRCSSVQKREVMGEKKITKTFQYDAPGQLVMTYLSQVSASCRTVSFAGRSKHCVDLPSRDVCGRQMDCVWQAWAGSVFTHL